MRESKKKNQFFKLVIKEVIIKIQIGLASYLKRQRCENYEENT